MRVVRRKAPHRAFRRVVLHVLLLRIIHCSRMVHRYRFGIIHRGRRRRRRRPILRIQRLVGREMPVLLLRLLVFVLLLVSIRRQRRRDDGRGRRRRRLRLGRGGGGVHVVRGGVLLLILLVRCGLVQARVRVRAREGVVAAVGHRRGGRYRGWDRNVIGRGCGIVNRTLFAVALLILVCVRVGLGVMVPRLAILLWGALLLLVLLVLLLRIILLLLLLVVLVLRLLSVVSLLLLLLLEMLLLLRLLVRGLVIRHLPRRRIPHIPERLRERIAVLIIRMLHLRMQVALEPVILAHQARVHVDERGVRRKRQRGRVRGRPRRRRLGRARRRNAAGGLCREGVRFAAEDVQLVLDGVGVGRFEYVVRDAGSEAAPDYVVVGFLSFRGDAPDDGLI